MPSVETTVTINAAPEAVWEVLTDITAYHEWNPYLVAGRGEVKKRKRLKIGMQIEEGHRFHAYPHVKVMEPHQKLVWKSKMYIPGVLDRKTTYELTPDGPYKTVFVHREDWTGFSAKGIFQRMGKLTERAMKAMNQALRKRVKAIAQQPSE